jgi:hypothetical protein
MLCRVVSQNFADVSEAITASIIKTKIIFHFIYPYGMTDTTFITFRDPQLSAITRYNLLCSTSLQMRVQV